MKLEILSPIIGVVIGWMLNEISQSIRIRREQKPHLSQTINALIDLSFLLKQRQFYLNSVFNAGRISRDGQEILRTFLDDKRVSSPLLKEKLDGACLLLRNIDPLEAYELELLTDSAMNVILRLHSKLNNNHISINDIEEELKILNIIIRSVDITTARLSWRFGALFWFKYKGYLKKEAKTERPTFDDFFKSI